MGWQSFVQLKPLMSQGQRQIKHQFTLGLSSQLINSPITRAFLEKDTPCLLFCFSSLGFTDVSQKAKGPLNPLLWPCAHSQENPFKVCAMVSIQTPNPMFTWEMYEKVLINGGGVFADICIRGLCVPSPSRQQSQKKKGNRTEQPSKTLVPTNCITNSHFLLELVYTPIE